MSRREQILAAVATALAGTTGVGTRIFRSRKDALAEGESPALVVTPAGEEVTELGQGLVEARLQVQVQVYARASAGQPADQAADPTCESAHQRLMASTTLGGLAFDIAETGTDMDFDDTDRPACWITMRYVVWYRRNRNSLV